jgi:hypothetical protein
VASSLPVHDPFIRPISLKNIPLDHIKPDPNSIKSSPLPDLISDNETEEQQQQQINPNLTPMDTKEDNTRYERKKIRKKVIITEIRYQNTQKGMKDSSTTTESSSSSSRKRKRKSKERQWTVTRKKKNFDDHYQGTYSKNIFQTKKKQQ